METGNPKVIRFYELPHITSFLAIMRFIVDFLLLMDNTDVYSAAWCVSFELLDGKEMAACSRSKASQYFKLHG